MQQKKITRKICKIFLCSVNSNTIFCQLQGERSADDKPIRDKAKQAENAFKLYDKDNDGFITKSEMEKLSKNLTKEQIDKIYERFDKDGDGRLTLPEFRKMMQRKLSVFSQARSLSLFFIIKYI